MNEIRLVRLTSGEELLCKKLNETGLTITIKQAVALVPTKERLGFMPVHYTHLTLPTIYFA